MRLHRLHKASWLKSSLFPPSYSTSLTMSVRFSFFNRIFLVSFEFTLIIYCRTKLICSRLFTQKRGWYGTWKESIIFCDCLTVILTLFAFIQLFSHKYKPIKHNSKTISISVITYNRLTKIFLSTLKNPSVQEILF